MEKSVGYIISLRRMVTEPRWVTVALRKCYWSPATGSRSRAVATSGFYADGMSEREIVESALRELLRAYVDEIG